MRIAFAGTPEFAAAALSALHEAGHDIAGVFTQPDRPAGRGQKLAASAVAERASALGLPLFKPEKFRAEAQEQLRALGVECFVVAAYGLILPQAALDIPPRGCLNIHASLLPRWRGAAPIQRALLAGDAESGVTVMQMEAGLDTGPMLLRESVPLSLATTAGELHGALAAMGARLIVRQLAAAEWSAQTQPTEGVTHAPKLTKDEARVDWQRAAPDIVRALHAYNPVPGAWSLLGEERVKLLRARVAEGSGALGAVLGLDAEGLWVGAGQGRVCITELQRPGSRAQRAVDAYRNTPPIGHVFS